MKSYKIVFCLLTILLVFFSCLTTSCEDKSAFKLPEFEKFSLDNGLTVYVMEQHEVPLIHISMVFPAGAVHDGDRYGLAFLAAEGSLFGTKSFTKKEIEDTVDFYGADLSINASKEFASINFSFAKKDIDKLLPILKEVVASPAFDEKEFDKRKQRLLMEMVQAKESPRGVIDLYFSRFLYGDHPYGNPLYGTATTVNKISAKDALEFHRSHYTPSRSAIAVVGDFDTDEMKSRITNFFGNWKSTGGELPDSIPSHSAKLDGNRILLVNKDDARETAFLIGGFGIRFDDPDYIGVLVINTILGGRFTSWLNDELRVNAGLTYGARSAFTPYKSSGTFLIRSYTRTAKTTEAVDLALSVLNRLHTSGVDEETLTSAKNYMKGQYPPRFETTGQLARLLTNMFAYGFDESFINNFMKNVDEITLKKAKALISKHFPKDKLLFVLIGKASEIKEAATKYGALSEKEIKTDGY